MSYTRSVLSQDAVTTRWLLWENAHALTTLIWPRSARRHFLVLMSHTRAERSIEHVQRFSPLLEKRAHVRVLEWLSVLHTSFPVLVSHMWKCPSSVPDTARWCSGDMWQVVTTELWLEVHCMCACVYTCWWLYGEDKINRMLTAYSLPLQSLLYCGRWEHAVQIDRLLYNHLAVNWTLFNSPSVLRCSCPSKPLTCPKKQRATCMKIIKTVQGDQYEQKREFSDTNFEIRSARFSISKLGIRELIYATIMIIMVCLPLLSFIHMAWHHTMFVTTQLMAFLSTCWVLEEPVEFEIVVFCKQWAIYTYIYKSMPELKYSWPRRQWFCHMMLWQWHCLAAGNHSCWHLAGAHAAQQTSLEPEKLTIYTLIR